MLYRAIRYIEADVGVDGVVLELCHFQTIHDAYHWLTPTLETQEQERWHLRGLQSVLSAFHEPNPSILLIGYNEPLNPEQSALIKTFLQPVESSQSSLPTFI